MGDAKKVVFSRVHLEALKLRSESTCDIKSANALLEATINAFRALHTAIHVPTTSNSQLIHLPS